MKIIDTIPFFMDHYQPSISFLQSYYEEYPDIFREYFAYHCKDTNERHNQSITKYPQAIPIIKKVHQSIKPIIHEITNQYYKIYHVSFPVDVNLIVGGFGSNAFTHRQIIPNITFALEKLSPEPDHLKVIVAHEFGHASHHIISDESGMDWYKMEWRNPLIWLNQEGAAIHFSKRISPGLEPFVYFSFDNDGEEWLSFAESNKEKIKQAFTEDYASKTTEQIFREWFSINGGKRFGYSRLGYFLGDLFFQNQVKQLGEMKAITTWKDLHFIDRVESWLK